MKKSILIGLFALTMVGCTNSILSNNGENVAKQQQAISRDQLISAGLNLLLTPNEVNNSKNPPISLDSIYQGMAKQGASLLGQNEQIAGIAKVMAAHQGQMMSSENPNLLIEAIKYLGTTEKGRQILAKGKYIFKNYSPVNAEQIAQLAELYKFRYLLG